MRDYGDGKNNSPRLEVIWAWASFLLLIVCWDAARRLDEHVSLPRVRIARAGEEDHYVQRVDSYER
jgi:hypothetical protein